jgi:hypothetical protein
MEIGDRHDREAARVPPRRGEAVGGRDQPFRLDRGRIDRGAGSRQPGGAEATQEKSTTTDRPATGDDVRFSGGYGSVTAVDGINRVHSVILGSWYLRQIKRQDKEAATEAALR